MCTQRESHLNGFESRYSNRFLVVRCIIIKIICWVFGAKYLIHLLRKTRPILKKLIYDQIIIIKVKNIDTLNLRQIIMKN